jgi:hypothetical protein
MLCRPYLVVKRDDDDDDGVVIMNTSIANYTLNAYYPPVRKT